jgi:monoamine oxidase
MRRSDCDIVTIGAGVSGLAATSMLAAAGLKVICLEATTRVGGRILTVRDPLAPIPIELGAEFVHGLPPETWNVIRTERLTAYEQTPCALHIDRGRVLKEKKVGEIADRILSQLGKSSRQQDESFAQYLSRSRQPPDVKAWAVVHIEGFNAARQELISTASLREDAEAADNVEGDRAFRILNGYDSIPLALLQSIPNYQTAVQLNSVVERILWRHGSVEVHYRSSIDNQESVLHCRRLIVTIPLGVLQASPGSLGALRFEPEPGRILKAAASLQSGHVYRVTFRFSEAFWEEEEKMKGAGFLVSRDRGFFTWWTPGPVIAPLLTGWSAGSAAEQFKSLNQSEVEAQALNSLHRILKRSAPLPLASYFHNWQDDAFIRGAYSYAPVNGLAARKVLAQPVDETLYFAGEATALNGKSGTVHGAIASGIRAAELILNAAGGVRRRTERVRA